MLPTINLFSFENYFLLLLAICFEYCCIMKFLSDWFGCISVQIGISSIHVNNPLPEVAMQAQAMTPCLINELLCFGSWHNEMFWIISSIMVNLDFRNFVAHFICIYLQIPIMSNDDKECTTDKNTACETMNPWVRCVQVYWHYLNVKSKIGYICSLTEILKKSLQRSTEVKWLWSCNMAGNIDNTSRTTELMDKLVKPRHLLDRKRTKEIYYYYWPPLSEEDWNNFPPLWRLLMMSLLLFFLPEQFDVWYTSNKRIPWIPGNVHYMAKVCAHLWSHKSISDVRHCQVTRFHTNFRKPCLRGSYFVPSDIAGLD